MKLSGVGIADVVPRELRGVAAFVGAYMAVAIAAALSYRNLEFLFYIAVMLVLIAAVLLVRRRVQLSSGLLWCLAVWGGLHMAGGLVPVPESWPIHGEIRVLYSWWIVPRSSAGGWLKYDQVVHAYGFGVTTWLCWQGLRGALAGDGPDEAPLRPTLGLMVLTAAAGAGFGALNEVVEFAATMMTVTNVGGYENTGWDLVYNAVGAVAAAALIYGTEGRGRGRVPTDR